MSAWTKRLRSIWHSDAYHGWGIRKKYFEGWYFKLVDRDAKNALALIPGIAMDQNGEAQAFIQIFDASLQKSHYIRYPAQEFDPSYREFQVKLAGNKFSKDFIQLDQGAWQAEIQIKDHHPWPSSTFSPGIMGWYSFVPFMQCYHGVVSMDSKINGYIKGPESEYNFDGGKVYMEKDWGSSFPRSWVWMQSNHFDDDFADNRISLKFSIAHIPWIVSSFIGFIGGFLFHGELIQFATYSGAKLRKVKIEDDKVDVVVQNPKYELQIRANRAPGVSLVSPILGLMDGRVMESLDAVLDVQLRSRKDGVIIYEGSGKKAGLEVAGDFQELEH
jgi:hypothetical protein